MVLVKSLILGVKYPFNSQNYFFVYLLITVLIEFSAEYLFHFFPTFEIGFIYNFYAAFCLLFYYLFYYKIFSKKRKIILSIGFILLTFLIILKTSILSLKFDNQIIIYIIFFNLFVSIIWFQQKLNSNVISKISDDPYFWISIGLLIWSCFSGFRFIPMYFISESDPGFNSFLRILLFIVNIIMYLFFFIALLTFEKLAKQKE